MPSISPLAILESARKRLELRRAWLHTDKGHDAETFDCRPCDPWDPMASRWDLHGALLAAGGGEAETAVAVRLLVTVLGYHGPLPLRHLTTWHDHPKRLHIDVLRTLDRGILSARRAESSASPSPEAPHA